MIYILGLFISLCLIIFQTAIVPGFSFLDRFFDVLIVYVLFLGFFRSFAESISIVFLLGLVMDSLAGGPFGWYLITYFWLYTGARWIKQFLHAGSLFLLPVFILFGVVFENFVFVIAFALTSPNTDVVPLVLDSLPSQFLWALLTGPLISFFIRQGYKKWDQWVRQLAAGRSERAG